MCGIYGAFSTDGERPIQADLLDRMDHVLAHRGPDGAGRHLAGPFAMGMRRLSIIDLAGGDQPIANEDGTVWVVFNGEIYNYRSPAVYARGHRLRTSSDNEVRSLYEEHGERWEPLGEFALAIWDQPAALFLAPTASDQALYTRRAEASYRLGAEALVRARAEPRPQPPGLAATGVRLRAGRRSLVGWWEGPKGTPHVRSGRTVRLGGTGRRPLTRAAAAPGVRHGGKDLWRSSRSGPLPMVSDVPVGAPFERRSDSMRSGRSWPDLGPAHQTFSVGFLEYRQRAPHARQVPSYGTEHTSSSSSPMI